MLFSQWVFTLGKSPELFGPRATLQSQKLPKMALSSFSFFFFKKKNLYMVGLCTLANRLFVELGDILSF